MRSQSFKEKNFHGDIIDTYHTALKCSSAWKNIKGKCTNEMCERDCEAKDRQMKIGTIYIGRVSD